MAWGDSFRAAWHHATDPVRGLVSATATGAKAASSASASLIQSLVRETKTAARSTEQQLMWSARAVSNVAKTAAHTADEAAEWGTRQTEQAAAWTGKKAITTARVLSNAFTAGTHAVVKSALAGYDNAKTAFSTATAAAVALACCDWNWGVDVLGLAVTALVTKPGALDIIRPLLQFGGRNGQMQFDGDVIGNGCEQKHQKLSAGVMPPNCHQRQGALPPVSYINGIDTDLKTSNPFTSPGLCKTMQEIARRTCSEVTGVYNATGGIGKDLDECLDNIAKSSSAPAVVPLRYMIVEAARSGHRLTLFAHSQGGLITQEAVAQAKQTLMVVDHLTSEEAEQKLGKISINSFGTAVIGWPKGPHYERFTNTCDPVPAIIAGAQTSYPIETLKDSASADKHYIFTSPHLNPLESHSMDDTYLPQYTQIKGAPHCACRRT